MNKNHISEFSDEELNLFLKEKMGSEEIEKWQKHYRECQTCQRYVEHSRVNENLLKEFEKESLSS